MVPLSLLPLSDVSGVAPDGATYLSISGAAPDGATREPSPSVRARSRRQRGDLEPRVPPKTPEANNSMKIETVGVVGCGLMGHGIVQVAAQGGCQVVAVESDAKALAKGLE